MLFSIEQWIGMEDPYWVISKVIPHTFSTFHHSYRSKNNVNIYRYNVVDVWRAHGICYCNQLVSKEQFVEPESKMGGQGKTINRKRKFVGRKADDPEFDLDKKHFKVLHLNASEKRLIIVLEGAQLETVKVSKKERNIWICAIYV